MKKLFEILGAIVVAGVASIGSIRVSSPIELKDVYCTPCETFQGYKDLRDYEEVIGRLYALDSLALSERISRGIRKPEVEVRGEPRILRRDNLKIGNDYVFEIGTDLEGNKRLIEATPCTR
ncbi:MAG: hypothetical protein KKB79_00715 [Nanoarchaeota archaeon]|nr:hypothetical protein [Nanoarchaeota archaeon]